MKLDIYGIKQLEMKIEELIEKSKNMAEEGLAHASIDTDIIAKKMVLDKAKFNPIKKHNKPDRVDLYDTITLKDNDSKEQFKVIINGNYENTEENDEIEFITVNSPLAEAVLGKPVGKDVNYKVGARELNLKIVDIKKPIPENLPIC